MADLITSIIVGSADIVTNITIDDTIFVNGVPVASPATSIMVGATSVITNAAIPQSIVVTAVVNPLVKIVTVAPTTMLVTGLGNDAHYNHAQNTPSSVWIINHYLNKYPSVNVFDSASDSVEGHIDFTNLNSLTITFSAAFSGAAYLN